MDQGSPVRPNSAKEFTLEQAVTVGSWPEDGWSVLIDYFCRDRVIGLEEEC